MTKIITFIIVVAVIFFTRKIWAKYIVLIFSKKKSLTVSIKQEGGSVFSPSGTIRTFIVAIDIEELGNGTAKISLAKLKDKEV